MTRRRAAGGEDEMVWLQATYADVVDGVPRLASEPLEKADAVVKEEKMEVTPVAREEVSSWRILCF